MQQEEDWEVTKTMMAVVVSVALLVLSQHARAQSFGDYVKSFGESVVCNLVDVTLRIPVPVCTFATNLELAEGLSLTVLSAKAGRYCGGGSAVNLNQARQLFDVAPDTVVSPRACAKILVLACARHGAGC